MIENLRCLQPSQRKVLVLGVDGFLGANLALALADRYAVRALCRSHPTALEGRSIGRFVPEGELALQALVRHESPSWIIYCGPLSAGSWDAPAEIPDAETEVRFCVRLAAVAARYGARLAVLSTDAVFSGPRIFHDESSVSTASHPLALAARRFERTVTEAGGLVVRTHAYGWGAIESEPSFAEQVWQALSEGTACQLDPHRYATPILATDLAELLDRAYRRRLQGLYHFAGAERVSQHRFATELAAAFGLKGCHFRTPEDRPKNVFPLAQRTPHDPREAVPRSGRDEDSALSETSLATRRACADLGCRMPSLREGLERFAAQARNGWRHRFGVLSRAA